MGPIHRVRYWSRIALRGVRAITNVGVAVRSAEPVTKGSTLFAATSAIVDTRTNVSIRRGGDPSCRCRKNHEVRMRVVSLNLDVPDAVVVRRALAGVMATCGCQQVDRSRCADCQALGAVVNELEACGRSAPRRREWPRGSRMDSASPPTELAASFARPETEPRLFILPEHRPD